MKRKTGLIKFMALLLSFAMMAGVCPIAALAAELEQPAMVQPATPEQAAPAESAEEAPEVPAEQEPAATEQTEEPFQQDEAQQPAALQESIAAIQSLASMPQTIEEPQETTPTVGGTITIEDIEYKVDRLPTATANGKLVLTNGKSYSGALVIADGIEYAGGKYDVIELAANAFSGNATLTSVNMTDSSVKSIKRNCFKDCILLTSVQFAADTVTNMQEAGVFSGCTSLTRLTIPSLTLSSKYNQSAFSGSSIQELTIYQLSSTGIKANLLNNMPDGFTLNLPNDVSSTALVATAFGNTKNVTLNLGTQEDVDHYKTVFEGKDVTVQLFGGEAEAMAFVTGSDSVTTGYATLNDAIEAINASADDGPIEVRTVSNGGTLIGWVGDVAPDKPTTIDFAGASVDLPDTLTLQAPLTIENITNINPDDDTLTTLIAGDHPFTMVDGGSFGFAEISGSGLTFGGTLPGGRFGGGQQVRLTGTGEGATVTFVNVGRSDYYYDLPLMAGFETLTLNGAYLEADGSDIFNGQLDGVTAVELKDGGLTLNKNGEIGTLTGTGELRLAGDATLKVTERATGSFRLPDFTGIDLAGSGLALPLGSEVTLTNGENGNVSLPQAVVEVKNLGRYATMADAFDAIETGDADSYTITLLEDVTLEANSSSGAYGVVELPAKALTIQGGSHTLTASDTRTRNYIYTADDLTLDNVKLNMPKTYLRITGEGATVTVNGNVTGELEKIDASVSSGCTVLVSAPVSDAVIDGIAGTSKNKMTVILQGYGSLSDPASKAAFPTISNSGGTLVLENSWLVADTNAGNWGSIEVRQGGGLSLTGSVPNASVKGWKVADGVVADLTVKNGKLTINGAVSGKTQIHFSGSQMTAAGKIPVKAVQASLDSFVLADKLDGLTLLPDADGNYTLMPLTVNNPVVTLSGGSFGNGVQFATWQDAVEILEKAAGSTATYTLTLNENLTLPEATTLPDVALVIDGDGHTLSLADGHTLKVQNSLTLQDVKLNMGGAAIQYTRSGNGQKTIIFAETASGIVGTIEDVSTSRWLDIVFMSNTVSFGKVKGTTSTIGTQLTDLILTGFGSKEEPINLAGKVENLAALELNGSWVQVEGDVTALGTIRTDYSKSDNDLTGGLVLTGDATVSKLSVTTNDAFEVWVPSTATLTVEEQYSMWKQQVPIFVDGELQEGHVLVKAPGNNNKNMSDYLLLNAPEGANIDLYWDADSQCYQVNCPPVITMSDEAMKYNDAYTKVVLKLRDAQGIASVQVNGKKDDTYTLGTSSYTPDVSLLHEGENKIIVSDTTGKQSEFTFTYEFPADYTTVEEALGKVPADLSGYTTESVQALQLALAAVQYGYGHTGQDEVDAMAQAVLDAIAGLKPVNTGSTGGQQGTTNNSNTGSNNASSNGTNNKVSQTAAAPAQAAAPAAQAAVTVVPQTSDTAEPALWIALTLLSLGGLAGLTVLYRRKQ